eukprot:gene7365-9751_t
MSETTTRSSFKNNQTKNEKSPLMDSPKIESGQPAKSRLEQPPQPSIWKGILIALSMGFIFGFAFEKSRVFEPVNIRRQFLFERWLMLKMFLAAMGTSALSLLIFFKFFPQIFLQVRDAFHGCYQRGIVTAVVPGGIMLGAGMAIGGGCPGMVAAQIGAGVDTAYATLLGAFTGALIYGLLEPFVTKIVEAGPKFKSFYIDEVTSIPFSVVGISLLLMSICGIVVMEVLEPWQDETNFPNTNTPCYVFGCKSWPPWVSGMFVGFLQVPAIAIIRDTLGSSTAYGAVCSLSTHAISENKREKYFKRFSSMRMGWMNWWQVIYLSAAMLGALVSAVSSNTLGDAHGITPGAGFIGGFLMLFGSRLAGGCTSGHGISGFTLGALASIIAVPSMFAGGIATAFIYQAADSRFPL